MRHFIRTDFGVFKMKKKIKDLTSEERERICQGFKDINCGRCPLFNLCVANLLPNQINTLLEKEVEVDE